MKGAVSEYFELTEITAMAVEVCATGAESPAPVELTLPIDPAAREPLEGMRVAFREPLTIIEYFEHAQYGQIVLGKGRQYQPTATFEPGSPEAVALAEKNAPSASRWTTAAASRTPTRRRTRTVSRSRSTTASGGDLVSNVIGVLDYRFAEWAIQPTQAADHVAANPRTDVPEVAGGTTVASFNVLNYFTTLGSRRRQRATRGGVRAPAGEDRRHHRDRRRHRRPDRDRERRRRRRGPRGRAQREARAEAYAAVPTGVLGTDEITTAFIYQPAG